MRFAGPRRVRNPGLAIDDLPPIDLVLVSYNHYDHLDLKALRTLVDKHDPVIATPLGNDVIIRAATPTARTITSTGTNARIGNTFRLRPCLCSIGQRAASVIATRHSGPALS